MAMADHYEISADLARDARDFLSRVTECKPCRWNEAHRFQTLDTFRQNFRKLSL